MIQSVAENQVDEYVQAHKTDERAIELCEKLLAISLLESFQTAVEKVNTTLVRDTEQFSAWQWNTLLQHTQPQPQALALPVPM